MDDRDGRAKASISSFKESRQYQHEKMYQDQGYSDWGAQTRVLRPGYPDQGTPGRGTQTEGK